MWWQKTYIHRRISSFFDRFSTDHRVFGVKLQTEYVGISTFSELSNFHFFRGLQFQESSEKVLQSALGVRFFSDFSRKKSKKSKIFKKIFCLEKLKIMSIVLSEPNYEDLDIFRDMLDPVP